MKTSPTFREFLYKKCTTLEPVSIEVDGIVSRIEHRPVLNKLRYNAIIKNFELASDPRDFGNDIFIDLVLDYMNFLREEEIIKEPNINTLFY